jgi:DNA polymerase II large subunit
MGLHFGVQGMTVQNSKRDKYLGSTSTVSRELKQHKTMAYPRERIEYLDYKRSSTAEIDTAVKGATKMERSTTIVWYLCRISFEQQRGNKCWTYEMIHRRIAF